MGADCWKYQTFTIKCGVVSHNRIRVDDPDAETQIFTWTYRRFLFNGAVELFDGELESKIKELFKGVVISAFHHIAYHGKNFNSRKYTFLLNFYFTQMRKGMSGSKFLVIGSMKPFLFWKC